MSGKWSRKRKIIVGIVVFLVGAFVFLHFPLGPVKIVISSETTVIDGPLNPDGTVNYVAALDAEYAKGVTPDNNAAPELIKVLGPEMLPEETRDQILDYFAITSRDLEGPARYVSWADFHSPAPASPLPVPDMPMASTKSGHAGLPKLPPVAGLRGPLASMPPAFTEDERDVLSKLEDSEVPPDLEAWLEKNAGAFHRLKEIVEGKPRFYIPLVTTSSPPQVVSLQMPNIPPLLNLSRGFMVRALWRSRNGDLERAWGDVMSAHRIARLLGQTPFSLGRLTSIGMDIPTSGVGMRLATRPDIDPVVAARMLAQLKDLPPAQRWAECLDRFERFTFLDSVMMLYRSVDIPAAPAHRGRAVDWNAIMRQGNEWYDKLSEAAQGLVYQHSRPAVAWLNARAHELEEEPSATRSALLWMGGWPCRTARSRDLGETLLRILLPSVRGALGRERRANMYHRIEMTTLALACYKAQHGHWPEGLDELVPSLLKEVPQDAFTGQPLVYRTNGEGYLLYSVGINQRDDGGVSDQQGVVRGDKDDIAARVNYDLPASDADRTTAPATPEP
jgi:hypothetical protein